VGIERGYTRAVRYWFLLLPAIGVRLLVLARVLGPRCMVVNFVLATVVMAAAAVHADTVERTCALLLVAILWFSWRYDQRRLHAQR
jgi:hypothetical protein